MTDAPNSDDLRIVSGLGPAILFQVAARNPGVVLADRSDVVIGPDGYTWLRRDLGEHPARLRYLDLIPLTYGRVRICRSDGIYSYGEAY